jgi:serine/threonine protein kinase
MPDLLAVDRVEIDIEPFLEQDGEILRAYRAQDSGCVSYVVEQAGSRYFVKHAVSERGVQGLGRAERLYAAVRHSALPTLLNRFRTPAGVAHVYEWVPGDVLYDYVAARGEAGRRRSDSPHARFRTLPTQRILESLETIYDLHVRIAAAGFIAVDFYDGCILYDFQRHRTWICDVDEYRVGPFLLQAERLPGSTRFMAPEEFRCGATIDQETNVFTLGRTAIELLSDGELESDAWRGTERMRAVLRTATSAEKDRRHRSVDAFVAAWHSAVAAAA